MEKPLSLGPRTQGLPQTETEQGNRPPGVNIEGRRPSAAEAHGKGVKQEPWTPIVTQEHSRTRGISGQWCTEGKQATNPKFNSIHN